MDKKTQDKREILEDLLCKLFDLGVSPRDIANELNISIAGLTDLIIGNKNEDLAGALKVLRRMVDERDGATIGGGGE